MMSRSIHAALWLTLAASAMALPQKPSVPAPALARPASTLAPVAGAADCDPRTVASRPAPRKPASHPHTVHPGVAKAAPATIPAKPPVTDKPTSAPAGGKAAAADKAPKASPFGPTAKRRDPFVSPVVERAPRGPSSCIGSGKKCLIVSEVTLRGVVHSPAGYIAVVANGEHSYFLRENDPLADGSVERITPDSITLRERSSDALGRPVSREVVKKLGSAPAL